MKTSGITLKIRKTYTKTYKTFFHESTAYTYTRPVVINSFASDIVFAITSVGLCVNHRLIL